MPNDSHRKRLAVAGQVQGVGFRPFVYRLAAEIGLTGWVSNDPSGVTIEVQGESTAVERFAARLTAELPPLASVQRCEQAEVPPLAGEASFEIRPSTGGELTDAQVTVDTATCDDCLREMRDPADPRYQYPFINCTNCGPRYSIVAKIPYDRANTTMADFAMCPLCGGEYNSPQSRRFHAQPIACPKCGPSVWLVDTQGKQIAASDAIGEVARMISSGKIVAIKGLGGFHLACRADDEHAVKRLRLRKHRDAKPFAVMVADIDHARALCRVDPAAAELLTGPLRPIVLLSLQYRNPLPDAATGPSAVTVRLHPVAPSVADGLYTLGVMLPYTPVHHLLFQRLAEIGNCEDLAVQGPWPPPLVMTSGNYSEEPLVKENDSAIGHLGQIADVILLHNRRIERRIDDSVVQIHSDGTPSIVRRGRGYAPKPVPLPLVAQSEQGILAVGAEFKIAICLLKGGRAVLSEHIGDLKDGRVYRHFVETVHHLEHLYEITPEIIVADLHPRYLSTEYALRRWRGELAGREAIPIVRVQHHHAHVASCLAEHGRLGPVIGIACDGVGYGDDGAAWGCEILQADLCSYERLSHLRYIHLPGGDLAASEGWRAAMGAMHDAFGASCADRLEAARLQLPQEARNAALEMLEMGVNTPPSSSLGRWFDAVAWMCGLAESNRFEGEAAMKLESAAAPGVRDSYPFRLPGSGPFLIDLRPMVEGVLGDLASGADAGYVAAKFHNTVARFLSAAARKAAQQTGLRVVALSGGCFANRYLTNLLTRELTNDGFEVLRHRDVPCNDGGVALGQAVIAAARMEKPSNGRAAGGKMEADSSP